MSFTIELTQIVAVLQTVLAIGSVFVAGAYAIDGDDDGWLAWGLPVFLVGCGLIFAAAAHLLWATP